MTGSLDRALKETKRRRDIQIAHNIANNVTPQTIIKTIKDIRGELDRNFDRDTSKILQIEIGATRMEVEEAIREKAIEMDKAAANLLFETAAILRDEITLLQKELAGKKPGTGKKSKRS